MINIIVAVIFNININQTEPELGYWLADIIKQETAVDFVLLPNKDGFNEQDTLVITSVTLNQLEQIISENISFKLLPISGLEVVFDSLNIITINPQRYLEQSYKLCTVKSLLSSSALITKPTNIIKKTITEIVIGYLQKNNRIQHPIMNRYRFANISKFLSSPKNDKININTANKDDLIKLPGIGEKLAQRIIDYRNNYGYFKTTKDILKVNGIGPKRYQQIKDLITVD
ncbi:MAG: ComEA family DNA-binding protein [candidate division WOR-3 bacterium]